MLFMSIKGELSLSGKSADTVLDFCLNKQKCQNFLNTISGKKGSEI